MTDREAFIAAILAKPADANLRLIYADWLEDHGEPGEAELMRNPPKYRPSNGTEGMIFDEQWCCRCTKNARCTIPGRAMVYEVHERGYPQEWLRVARRHICTAFVDQATHAPPVRTRKPAKGQMSLFVLEGSS